MANDVVSKSKRTGVLRHLLKQFSIPLTVFILLATVTGLVWREQIFYRKRLLQDHTTDLSNQAARRLEVFVDSQIMTATILLKRFLSQENEEFTEELFQNLSSFLRDIIPGYEQALYIPWDDKRKSWSSPSSGTVLSHHRSPLVFQGNAQANEPVIFSPPITTAHGHTVVSLIWILYPHHNDSGGAFIIDLDTASLINACFHTRIQSEFYFYIQDNHRLLFRSNETSLQHTATADTTRSTVSFPMYGRIWSLTLIPKVHHSNVSDTFAEISFPLMGFILSIGLSALVFLLFRRLSLYRIARDRIIEEMKQRERLSESLKLSESRYRNIFNTSTDGLLILDINGTVIEANPRVATIYGYNSNEIKNRNFSDLLYQGGSVSFDQLRDRMDLFGFASYETKSINKKGNVLDIELRGTKLDYEGKPRFLVIITDVTQRNHAIQRHMILSQKALKAQEEERARLSRELHDELGQLLTALLLESEWVQKKIEGASRQDGSVFRGIINLAEKANNELHGICKGLHPPLLDDLGLESAARQLVEDFQERTGLFVNLKIISKMQSFVIPSMIALCAYRILQESLTNARRHAMASSVEVSLVLNNTELILTINDDGIGFNPEDLGEVHGCGIIGMQERSNLVNGIFKIRSSAHKGTQIYFKATIPYHENEDNYDTCIDSR